MVQPIGSLISSNERKTVKTLDAHQRFAIALIVAIVVFLLSSSLKFAYRTILTWNAFAWSAMFVTWVRIFFADARASIRSAKLQDSGRTAIFIFVVFSTVASLFAVALLIGTAKGLKGEALSGHILLAAGTVVSSWALVHTVFAMHYAHLFYRDLGNDTDSEEGSGLDFPDEKTPDFLDFAYFSFVIGMTFQVSDVQITSRSIRRLALLHGILSFVFNTLILALSINLISGLF
jgi:uncharacterized membrane protein